MVYTTVPAAIGAVLLAAGLVLPWFQRRPSSKAWDRDPVAACGKLAEGQRWPRRGSLVAIPGALLISVALQGAWASWIYLPIVIIQGIGYRLTFQRENYWWFKHAEWIDMEHDWALLINRLLDGDMPAAVYRAISELN